VNKKLYYHKTDGGAEYLTDKFIVCPNDDKEAGIYEADSTNMDLTKEPDFS
jgi:hypothetical protein